MGRSKQRFPGAARYAAQAASMMMSRIYPASVVEKQLRKTLAFWCYADNIDLQEKPSLAEVKQFARLFHRHLELNRKREQTTDEFDVSCHHVDRAALQAVREWASRPADPSTTLIRSIRQDLPQQDQTNVDGEDDVCMLYDEERELYRLLREDWLRAGGG